MLCVPCISRTQFACKGTHFLQRTFIVSCFFLFFVAIVHINIVYLVQLLNNPRARYLPTHIFVLVYEAAQHGILVANLPPLIHDDGHEHQHHHNHGGGEGYGEDKSNVHLQFLRDYLKYPTLKAEGLKRLQAGVKPLLPRALHMNPDGVTEPSAALS